MTSRVLHTINYSFIIDERSVSLLADAGRDLTGIKRHCFYGSRGLFRRLFQKKRNVDHVDKTSTLQKPNTTTDETGNLSSNVHMSFLSERGIHLNNVTDCAFNIYLNDT